MVTIYAFSLSLDRVLSPVSFFFAVGMYLPRCFAIFVDETRGIR